MKRFVNAIKHEPCREKGEVDENARQAFSEYRHLQYYHPGMRFFPFSECVSRKDWCVLPTRNSVRTWKEKISDNCWKVEIEQGQYVEDASVFVKVKHLIDPIDLMKGECQYPPHPLIPFPETAWNTTYKSIQHPNNQAYVDTVTNYILSKFRENDVTPHCVLMYGSMTGISNMYSYNISDDYTCLRESKWFWKGLEVHKAALKVDTDIELDDDMKEYFSSPFKNTDNDTILELQPINDNQISDNTSVHSIRSIKSLPLNTNNDTEKDTATETSDITSDDDSETSDIDVGISIEIPNIPVIMIFQEKQEGTMDDLMDQEDIDGHLRGSKEWRERWIAWIWQVISVLSLLQSTLCFTHNDLHTNNILWRNTDISYLYYRASNGRVWKVPTFGKIFSIIDFGRSILRLSRSLIVSDDHWPEHDAGGQYNFGPFFNPSLPRINPNPSFDLSRLAVSLLDGLYDEKPSRRAGTHAVLSEEGSWKVYETVCPLFNLLWSWTIDNAGKTIYEDREGNERYPGFELYVHIAHNVHSAIPREQLVKSIFTRRFAVKQRKRGITEKKYWVGF